jgi:nicotinate-nucleotide adenylyltransferase
LARRAVGLLGGSFNPAHEGHLHLSLEALKRLGLDEVWWLVSPQNPLKPARGMASLERRMARAREVARHSRIRVTDVERDLGTRFTVDTLRRLKRRFPQFRFVWLMGADNLSQIPSWKGWTEIFRLAPIAVFDRPPYARRALAGKAAQRFWRARVGPRRLSAAEPPAWAFVRMKPHPASATAIRAGRRWPA